ncbi:PLP-dependent aminotransferase family protein [Motiliproteus sp. SC1-56]|uniref:aminotransferase-like domain-containing protein n=1 Tax=Motiliproteus sp. SC1-56 TaxID=2799565 RepID=UPI001A8EE84D|nr:PLP-dependent aminotransferase family protein [Motiliproteus sp. SC1-56]
MLSIDIHRDNDQPLVEQIVQAVMNRVDSHGLRPGSRVPSIRRFAESHGVSRFTVVQAYDRLVAAGYLNSRQGSGFYVSQPPLPLGQEAQSACDLDQAVDVLWLLRRAMEDQQHRFQPGCGWLPASWLDGPGIQRSLRQLARGGEQELVSYGRAAGYRPLRQLLQQRLGEAGIRTDLNQILLTHGASHGLDLVGRYLVRPGDTVLVDDPAYFNLFGYLKSLGARVVGVPRGEDGPDVDAMARLLELHSTRLFITSSLLHNPTGSSITPAVAFQLLRLAEQHDFMIVDDDIYGDLHPGAEVRLGALDQLNRVIHVSSFSKTISANLRVGYLACHPALARELLDLKLLTHIATNALSERVIYEILNEGHYRKHLQRLRSRLDRARDTTLARMARLGLTPFIEPRHGMFIWARLPGEGRDAAALAHRALQDDMVLAPGNTFRPDLERSSWLRFNVAFCEEPAVFELLARLLDG